MQFKKNRAILAAVLATAMASSALMTSTASAAGTRTKAEAYGDETYAQRFLSLYDDVVTKGQENGYLSTKNVAPGGFGVPYHSIETVICEAPDYGHETTSEAMSYIVWIAAMEDNITANTDYKEATSDLAKAWKTLEVMIPTEQSGFWSKSELSAQVAKEYPEGPENYPSEGNQSNVGKNPIHSQFTSAYSSQNGEYLMHWLADVDDWYGFGGSAEGELGTFTFINTFQRGDQESCFETIPHPCVEELTYGNSTNGMKFAFADGTTAPQWSYTNAPDAENRAIQAVYAANRWGVGDANVSSLAGMMGDQLRNDMFDKYYKAIGCQNIQTDASGGGLQGQHFLMSWYTAWGGALDGQWSWQIGCSHSHMFYQSPLAAYALLYDADLNAGMKSSGAVKDYTTSLQRQLEMYMWLQSPEGMFAGGCTNSWNGKYESYPASVSTFYDMAYDEHPVYKDPGSNRWIGNQVWATQRLAELYYIIKTEGDASNGSIKPGGVTMEEALSTMLEKWCGFMVENTDLTDDGDYAIISVLDWDGQPDTWTQSFNPNGNTGLSCTVAGKGNSDLGCVSSLANTLIHYAAAEGVQASGTVAEGTTVAEKSLYVAQQLMDRAWNLGRDDVGLSRTEYSASLCRLFDQEVYVPAGKEGTYPYGDVAKNGIKFCDIRTMYEEEEKFQELKAAYEADKANGATTFYDAEIFATNCDDFVNVGSVELNYHRFWHAGDILMALGSMYELYPDVTPSDTVVESDADWGNVDCSEGATPEERVTVADAVLLSRYVAEDSNVTVTAQGQINADCAYDGIINANDVSPILQFLSGLLDYSELGNQQ